MTWQEPVVAVVVGLAVVSLYRHLRAELRIGGPGQQASCHGCDDCENAEESAAPTVSRAIAPD